MKRLALTRRHLLGGGISCAMSGSVPAMAHPLPDTVITLFEDGGNLELSATMPVLDLGLAVQTEASRLLPDHADTLRDYFDAHVSVLAADGSNQAVRVVALEVLQSKSEDAGNFETLRVEMRVAAADGFDPRDFTLKYDVIMHQVPNHRAVVQWAQEGADTIEVGVISFDIVSKATPPLRVAVPH